MFFPTEISNLKTENIPSLTVYRSTAFAGFEAALAHGFSSREGGCSKQPYTGCNLGLTSGDKVEDVQANRIAFAEAVGILPSQVACGIQVHSTNIYTAGKADAGKGYLDVREAVPDTDGMVTNVPGVALITLYADCTPILYYNPVQQVIAVTHCGWKGTVGKIATKMIRRMEEEFGCQPADTLVAIGPSISQANYEVDEPVLARVREAFSFAEEIIQPVDETHGKVDLWKANRRQLMEAGVLPEHIDVSGMCTYQMHDTFYSHRYDKGITGRNAALIMLKE